MVLAERENVSGNKVKKEINSGESIDFRFDGYNDLFFKTNISLILDLTFDNSIENIKSSMEIHNHDQLYLKVKADQSMEGFGFSEEPGGPETEHDRWVHNYDCIFQIQANDTIEELKINFEETENHFFSPEKEYSVAIFKENQEIWELEETESGGEDVTYLEATLSNLKPDMNYYITIFEVEVDNSWLWYVIIVAIVVSALVIALSKTEFINYLKTRNTYIEKGSHRLSMEEVLENDNRNKIIELILEEPGIHFNELLRKTEFAPGNLAWHLDILKTYKIIGKKRIGNFLAYFPYYPQNPISNLDLKLSKSKLTLEILKMIEKEPGIWNNLITQRKKISHKTIQYHIDKLLDLELIFTKKEGRKKKIYPNLDSEFFQDSGFDT